MKEKGRRRGREWKGQSDTRKRSGKEKSYMREGERLIKKTQERK